MIKNLTLLTIISLLLCCCDKPQHESPKPQAIEPLFEVKLPLDESRYIYNGGLIYPPLYNDQLICHTTLKSSNGEEDNRLCAVNIETHSVDWLFPTDENKTHNYCFGGEGYIYSNYLVVKSRYDMFNPQNYEYITCVDLTTNTVKWELSLGVEWASSGDVIGSGQNCYFANNDDRLYCANIITRDTCCIYDATAESEHSGSMIGRMLIRNSDSQVQLLLFVSESDKSESVNYLVVFDLLTNTVRNRFKLPADHLNSYGIDGAILFDDNVIIASGALTACVNPINGEVIWQTYRKGSNCFNLAVDRGILFSNGDSNYIGLNAKTGAVVYQNNQLGSWWAVVNNGYVYLNGRDGKIHIINILNGTVVDKIVCPNPKGTSDGFNVSTNAVIYSDKLFLMGYQSLYCYPVYPWQ